MSDLATSSITSAGPRKNVRQTKPQKLSEEVMVYLKSGIQNSICHGKELRWTWSHLHFSLQKPHEMVGAESHNIVQTKGVVSNDEFGGTIVYIIVSA